MTRHNGDQLAAVLSDIARRLDLLEAAVASIIPPAPESYQANYLTLDAQGNVGAAFSGNISALGLVIPTALAAAQASNQIRWIRGFNGSASATIESFDVAATTELDLISDSQASETGGRIVALSNKAGATLHSALILDGLNESSFGVKVASTGVQAGPTFAGTSNDVITQAITTRGGPVLAIASGIAENDGTNGTRWISTFGLALDGSTPQLFSTLDSSVQGTFAECSGVVLFPTVTAGPHTIHWNCTSGTFATWGNIDYCLSVIEFPPFTGV